MKYAIMWMLVWGHPDANNIWIIQANPPGKWTHTEKECLAQVPVQSAEEPASSLLWCVKIALSTEAKK